MTYSFKFNSCKNSGSRSRLNLSRNAIPMRTPAGTSPASAVMDAEAWQDETDQGRDRS